MINQIRYQQFRRQVAALSQPMHPLAVYSSRDPVTGQRIVRLADGSIDHVNYLADSEPANTPQYQPGRLGIPGFINNK